MSYQINKQPTAKGQTCRITEGPHTGIIVTVFDMDDCTASCPWVEVTYRDANDNKKYALELLDRLEVIDG